MIKTLKAHHRWNETLFLGIVSILCFCFSIFRFLYTKEGLLLFLNWNLFLAFIPWALSTLAIIKPKLQTSKYSILILLSIWLLFFPNAPYILTDLFHLHNRPSIPMWFDLILILFFAWTGLLFGFMSLWDIERVLNKSISQFWISLLSTVLLFIGSFGIYLGRYLRWNSWDIIRDPFGLLQSIGARFINPFDYKGGWGMVFFMGLLLNMFYWSFRMIKRRI